MLKTTPRVKQPEESGKSETSVRSLFDAEEAPLLRYAVSLVGRRAVAEEIVQEVFLQLHIRWDQVESPRAWLYRSVRNAVFNHLRKSRRESLDANDDPDRSPSSESELPESGLMRVEARVTLQEILDELNETDRQLVKLKYFEGLRYREISQQTGLSVGNVGYRLHHILKVIAAKLRPFGIDDIS